MNVQNENLIYFYYEYLLHSKKLYYLCSDSPAPEAFRCEKRRKILDRLDILRRPNLENLNRRRTRTIASYKRHGLP